MYYSYTLAIDENDNLYGWGRNNFGQLGTGNLDNQLYPTQIGVLKWKSI